MMGNNAKKAALILSQTVSRKTSILGNIFQTHKHIHNKVIGIHKTNQTVIPIFVN
jgi:hypothetical protein